MDHHTALTVANGGPRYIRALKMPFPDTPMIAAGGVDQQNALFSPFPIRPPLDAPPDWDTRARTPVRTGTLPSVFGLDAFKAYPYNPNRG